MTCKTRNKWILEKVGEEKTVGVDVVSRKLTYFGDIIRDHCLELVILQGMNEGISKDRKTTSWLA